jgi:integrase
VKFTEASVKAFVMPAGKDDHYEWDDAMPGFGFRCRNVGGSKVYLVKYRVGDKQRKLTLGATNKVTLDTAKINARAIFGKVAMKIDPANELAQAAADASNTFDTVIGAYLETVKQERSKSHYEATKRALQVRFKNLHGLALASISRSTVATELQAIKKDQGPIAMNRARTYLSSFFNWAIGEGLCEANPVDKTNRNEENSRDRVLKNTELKTIWRALPDNDFGKCSKLLMLTAQRRNEIGGLKVSEFNRAERQIELPPERTKNSLPHIVPLSDMAMSILESVDMDGKEFVFGRRADSGFSGWGDAKTMLDQEAEIDHWTLHDFRRTGSTRMGDEGVLPHVVEAVLNHISGNKAGVAGTYNKAMYLTEKREALNTLASFIERVVG